MVRGTQPCFKFFLAINSIKTTIQDQPFTHLRNWKCKFKEEIWALAIKHNFYRCIKHNRGEFLWFTHKPTHAFFFTEGQSFNMEIIWSSCQKRYVKQPSLYILSQLHNIMIEKLATKANLVPILSHKINLFLPLVTCVPRN